jgi:hypothetical protein
VQVSFDLGCGSNYRAPAGAWASGGYLGANGAVNLVATSGAALWISGVKLEVGSIATPYNRQSLAKSLVDCQRYYQGSAASYVLGYNLGTMNIMGTMFFQPMRATPTITPTYSGASNVTGAYAISINGSNSFYSACPVTATGSAQYLITYTLSAEF